MNDILKVSVQNWYRKIPLQVYALLKNLHYSLPLSVGFQEPHLFDDEVVQNVFEKHLLQNQELRKTPSK